MITPKAAFRKKYGIAPKGDGPHDAEAYGLPVPPKSHALAKPFARAVLKHAKTVLAGGKYDADAITAQVRKANVVLYGKPAPTAAEKKAAQRARADRDFAFYTSETMREAYIPGSVDGSWEDLSDRIVKAAQTSDLFGGPAIAYGQPGWDDDDACRPYDIAIAVAYPTRSQVVISNSRTGEMWLTTFAIGDDDGVAFSGTTPADLQVVAKNQEALRAMREAGRPGARAYPVRVEVQLREAAANDDGTVTVMAIRVGDGNPTDKNYYDEGFIDDVVAQLGGMWSYRDHPTLTEERDLPERSVDRLAGWFSDPYKGDFTDPSIPGATPVKAAFAKFHPVVDDAKVAGLLRTQREKYTRYPDKEPFVGFSINAYGVGAPGENPVSKEPRNVTSRCTQLLSVDMVTHAGAGGRPMQESSGMKNRPVLNGNGRIDPDVEIDIRTDAEKAEDQKAFLQEANRAAIVDLFNGPIGPKLREAAGVAADADVSDSSAFSHKDVAAIASKIGLKPGGKMHQMMKDNLVDGTASGGAAKGEESNVSGGAAPSEPPALTAAAIESMTPAQLKEHALKSISGAPAPAAKSAREIELEAKLEEATRAQGERDLATVVEKTLDALKIEGAHRTLAEAQMRAGKTNEEIVRLGRAYRDAHLLHPQGSSGVQESRSSASGSSGARGGSLTFLKS